jgi:aspartyl-tRNA(Asn)/glutamyl-tRNA(Gln) amidotransferase subunit C
MEIKREDIEHIAKLSMLNLSEEEIVQYTKNMQDIVNFANTVNEVNTEGLDISAFALDAYNVFRKDELKDSFNREELLMNAPSSNGEAFSLPSVME